MKLPAFGVVVVRHIPPIITVVLVEFNLCIAVSWQVVIVVAQDCVPRNESARPRVNVPVSIVPLRISVIGRSSLVYVRTIEVITQSHDKLRMDFQ